MNGQVEAASDLRMNHKKTDTILIQVGYTLVQILERMIYASFLESIYICLPPPHLLYFITDYTFQKCQEKVHEISELYSYVKIKMAA